MSDGNDNYHENTAKVSQQPVTIELFFPGCEDDEYNPNRDVYPQGNNKNNNNNNNNDNNNKDPNNKPQNNQDNRVHANIHPPKGKPSKMNQIRQFLGMGGGDEEEFSALLQNNPNYFNYLTGDYDLDNDVDELVRQEIENDQLSSQSSPAVDGFKHATAPNLDIVDDRHDEFYDLNDFLSDDDDDGDDDGDDDRKYQKFFDCNDFDDYISLTKHGKSNQDEIPPTMKAGASNPTPNPNPRQDIAQQQHMTKKQQVELAKQAQDAKIAEIQNKHLFSQKSNPMTSFLPSAITKMFQSSQTSRELAVLRNQGGLVAKAEKNRDAVTQKHLDNSEAHYQKELQLYKERMEFHGMQVSLPGDQKRDIDVEKYRSKVHDQIEVKRNRLAEYQKSLQDEPGTVPRPEFVKMESQSQSSSSSSTLRTPRSAQIQQQQSQPPLPTAKLPQLAPQRSVQCSNALAQKAQVQRQAQIQKDIQKVQNTPIVPNEQASKFAERRALARPGGVNNNLHPLAKKRLRITEQGDSVHVQVPQDGEKNPVEVAQPAQQPQVQQPQVQQPQAQQPQAQQPQKPQSRVPSTMPRDVLQILYERHRLRQRHLRATGQHTAPNIHRPAHFLQNYSRSDYYKKKNWFDNNDLEKMVEEDQIKTANRPGVYCNSNDPEDPVWYNPAVAELDDDGKNGSNTNRGQVHSMNLLESTMIREAAREMVKLTNLFRLKQYPDPYLNSLNTSPQPLSEVHWDTRLGDIAYPHSKDMGLGKVPFSHVGFDERCMKYPAPYQTAAENLACGKDLGIAQMARSAVDGWINSPGHRENLLSGTKWCGIGLYRSLNGEWYATQLFGLY
jgi:uncharacterized protein YkwD